jgi:two-component system sensor histidine kinase/response regulator
MIADNHRILIADDLPDIHEDYRKILTPRTSLVISVEGMADFAPHFTLPTTGSQTPFQLETVMQGEDAIQAVTRARSEGRPFAMVFLDVRMPPGIDGIETAMRLREIDPSLQVVLCTAYSDYSFADISQRFKKSDGLLILKKPFDPAEVQQLAQTLCRKWTLSEENKKLVNDLESRVQLRTAELEGAKGKLEVALHRAEAASLAKTDFLRCVSHELNTPLNGILGVASMIELSTDPELVEMGSLISESSERLNRLFARILLYLEIDTVPCQTFHCISMPGLVEQAVLPHRAHAEAKGVSFQCENLCPPVLWLHGETLKLHQAVTCLVENAVKFTAHGQVDVRLSVRDSCCFVAEISDTGPGIEGPQLTRLYELFSPGDVRSHRSHDGIGMGLPLVRRIAEHMGGAIAHRNRADGGSVFTLTLPCKME